MVTWFFAVAAAGFNDIIVESVLAVPVKSTTPFLPTCRKRSMPSSATSRSTGTSTSMPRALSWDRSDCAVEAVVGSGVVPGPVVAEVDGATGVDGNVAGGVVAADGAAVAAGGLLLQAPSAAMMTPAAARIKVRESCTTVPHQRLANEALSSSCMAAMMLTRSVNDVDPFHR
jgi:hypothetical protein